jgi:hypothetical protein
MLRIAFASLLCCAAVPADAAMLLNFEPASDGGVRLTAHYSGTLSMQVIDPRFCNVGNMSGEILTGGSSDRDSLRFADLINENIIADGDSLEIDYVRVGNHVSRDSLAFYMYDNRVVTGSEVEIDFVSEWRVNNLAYSLMVPGTYTAFAAPYGQAIITVAAVPEPSTALSATITALGGIATIRRCRRREEKAGAKVSFSAAAGVGAV